MCDTATIAARIARRIGHIAARELALALLRAVGVPDAPADGAHAAAWWGAPRPVAPRPIDAVDPTAPTARYSVTDWEWERAAYLASRDAARREGAP